MAVAIEADPRPSIDWPAVIAGAVLTAAISFVLLTFGTGIGLSITSPYPREGVSVTGWLIILALWLMWVSLSSFFAGGYLAGRMRRAIGLSPHETEVRDGVHGLLVWAVGLLLSALIALWTASGVAHTGAEAATATAAAGAAGMTNALAKSADPVGYLTDTLFRPGPGAAPTTARGGDPRAEAARIFARSATDGNVSQEDQAYLAQAVSRETGLNEADAHARVDAVLAQYRTAVQQARDAAERARKGALLAAFLTAATLAISAAAAWWAATRGGMHRDEGRDFSAMVRWA